LYGAEEHHERHVYRVYGGKKYWENIKGRLRESADVNTCADDCLFGAVVFFMDKKLLARGRKKAFAEENPPKRKPSP